MPRYKLLLEYDGTGFSGWQIQPDHPSIQGALEEALFRFCGERAEIIGAGRTDAGVHASGQTAHVDLAQEYDPFRILSAMNFHLRDTETGAQHIAILAAEPVAGDFHARFSATRRSYSYRILNRRAPAALHAGHVWHIPIPLDIKAMQQAAKYLLGHHDFTSFRDSACQAKSPMKTLDALTLERQGDEIHLHTHARSFLHHQVRIMAGTLSLVGLEKWSPEQVAEALAACDRCVAGPTAPPQGLYLTGVGYN